LRRVSSILGVISIIEEGDSSLHSWLPPRFRVLRTEFFRELVGTLVELLRILVNLDPALSIERKIDLFFLSFVK